MWAAKDAGEEVCYSYENCGSVDYWTDGPQRDCIERGGTFIKGACTCDVDPTDCGKGISPPPDFSWIVVVVAAAALIVIVVIGVIIAGVCCCQREVPVSPQKETTQVCMEVWCGGDAVW